MTASGNLLKIRLGGGSAQQAATTAWVNAVLAAGGTVSAIQRSMVNTLIRDLTVSGVWSKAYDLWLRCTENSTEAYVSLKQLRTVTPHNTPAHIPWRGVAFDGATQYDDTGFIPSVHAVGADIAQALVVREQTNINSLAAAIGSQLNALRVSILFPRNSISNMSANLDSTIVQGPSNTDSRRLIGAQRDNTDYTFYIAGVNVGTGTPITPGTQLSTVTTFLGANNVNGTPASLRQSIQAVAGFLAPLTDAEWLAFNEDVERYLAAALLLVDLNVYVSSVDYGGIPIGSDTNGNGQIDDPLLTLTRGLSYLPPGGTLHANGETGSPTTYVASQDVVLSDAVTIEPVESRGATFAGYSNVSGLSHLASIGLTNGGTVTVRGIWDCALNALGAAFRGFDLTTQTLAYGLTLDDAEVLNWASTFALSNLADNLKIELEITGVDFVSGPNVRGCIDLRNLASGTTIAIDTVSIVLNSNLGGFGAILLTAAVSAGIEPIAIAGLQIENTVAAGFVGSVAHGISVVNIPTVIDGVTVELTDPTVAAPAGHGLAISPGRLASGNEQSIAGSKIQNFDVLNTCDGGTCVRIGDDFVNCDLAADCEMGPGTTTGSAEFMAGGGHSVWPVNTLRMYCHDIVADYGGIGLVDKGNRFALFERITVKRHNSSYILSKGSLYSVHRDFTLYAELGFSGAMIQYSEGDENNEGIWSIAEFSGGTLEVDGATNIKFISIPLEALAGGGEFTITGCNFVLTSGSLNANPFTVFGVNYPTFAAFNAVYPGNTANFRERCLMDVQPDDTVLGVRRVLLLPGAAGVIMGIIWRRQYRLAEALTAAAAGACCVLWVAPAGIEWIEARNGMAGLISWACGLAGMYIVDGISKVASKVAGDPLAAIARWRGKEPPP